MVESRMVSEETRAEGEKPRENAKAADSEKLKTMVRPLTWSRKRGHRPLSPKTRRVV